MKFVAPRVIPKIEISAIRQGSYWLFEVSDNGIGIESNSLEKIFDIFHRTHSSKNYPGTDIGLATCKKIVENHGGRLWATLQLDLGTTFHFYLMGATKENK